MIPLVDSYGRVHTYLRVSVTDRCNYRCVYCMPASGMVTMPRAELLTFEELTRVLTVFAGLGIRRVRLTGGEPTMRSGIVEFVRSVAAIDGIDDIAMTTNGHTLPLLADKLADAGLRRLNVSLDTLRPERFARITRGGDLQRVLEGIRRARAAGLVPLKINAVIMKGENDDELVDMVEHFAPHAGDTELRFIEYMPFEERWHDNVKAADLLERLARHYHLAPTGTKAGAGPARTWRIAENGLVVGFIAPLSQRFCSTCNRLRLMTDGHLRTCLAHEDTPSLRDLLRGGADDATLAHAIRAMVRGKPDGHHCETDGGKPFEGVMTGIGG